MQSETIQQKGTNTMTDNRIALAAEGFTIAGGMWGEAAWLQPRADVVISIMDSRCGLSDPHPSEGWTVWTYRGPFMSEWTGVEMGEAPVDDLDQGKMETVADMAAAIARVRAIVAAL